MRVKNVHLGIKSVEDMLSESQDVMKQLERGGKISKKKLVFTLKTLRLCGRLLPKSASGY